MNRRRRAKAKRNARLRKLDRDIRAMMLGTVHPDVMLACQKKRVELIKQNSIGMDK